MSLVNIIIIGAIILIVFAIGIWYTVSEFSSGHVEDDSTQRREKLEDDVKVDHEDDKKR